MYDALEIKRPLAETIMSSSIFILPLGSLEQHGPHLPLGTDTYIAEEISIRVANEIENSVLLPILPYGYSWVWRDIPATVTIKEKTLEVLIKEIAHSVCRHNPKALVVINWHGANVSAIKYAARDLVDEIPLKFYYFNMPSDENFLRIMDSKPSSLTIHAEEIETSIMLLIKPELVDKSLAKPEYPAQPKAYGKSALCLGTLSKSGIYGDPSVATKEKGERFLSIMVDDILSTLREEKII